MKIAAELKIKHGHLYECCQSNGGIESFAKKIGIGYQTVLSWLHLKRCPTPKRYTRHYTKEVESKLEAYSGMPIEELFPVELSEFVKVNDTGKFVAIQDIEPVALMDLSRLVQERLAASSPVDDAIASELQDKIKAVLSTLPEQCQMVLNCRFEKSMTLDEVGREMRLSRERIRQIEEKGIRILQQHSNASKLIGYID